ncbi:hypothetical protein B4102_2359 [Heyndrickxia sporothermodurans]|uniref:Uncharacterized protein n=1 Tax=Heyndrickxia sporothermodurans TaxID=46224 RepID=A0A150LCV6_9BACI|nr:hypothetical protein B4102_2359 [Heyndrickxia sporothermodurans]
MNNALSVSSLPSAVKRLGPKKYYNLTLPNFQYNSSDF